MRLDAVGTKHFIVAPAIHLQNTLGFVDALDSKIARDRLILVDNTDKGIITGALIGRAYNGYAAGANIGVATAWNIGIQIALHAGAEMVTLMSTSCRTNGRDLCEIADFCIEQPQWQWGFESRVGWKCITFGRRTIEQVGLFDEKFWPAYFEDNDYVWRLRCAGILPPVGEPRINLPWVPTLKPDIVMDAHAIHYCDIEVNFAGLEEYYTSKWGGKPGEEQWTIPNDPASERCETCNQTKAVHSAMIPSRPDICDQFKGSVDA